MDPSEPAPHKDRAPRRDVWAPVEIRPQERSARLGIVHNASSTGALLAARTKLEPGQDVQLRIATRDGSGASDTLAARVVRLEDFDETSHWPWSIAVRFEAPIDELMPELERMTPPRYGR